MNEPFHLSSVDLPPSLTDLQLLKKQKNYLPPGSFFIFKLYILTISIKINKIFIILALVQALVITLHIINYATKHFVSFYKWEKKLLMAHISSFFDFKDIFGIDF